MLYRPLGRTDLSISEIGFGCASWWGKPAFAEREALALVHAALDHGVTFFDTGASYSLGQAEGRLGRALKGRGSDQLVIATKAGTFHAGGGKIARDFSPPSIIASLQRSLKLLGQDQVALLQLHGPALHELTDDLFEALERARAAGLVRAFGVNSFDPVLIERVCELPIFDVVMIDYNILRPGRARLAARAAAAGKGVLAGMALGMGRFGLPAPRPWSARDLWYVARSLRHHRQDLAGSARFGFLRRLPDMTAAQAALAYVLGDPNVASAVMGTTRMAHLLENLAASGMSLSPETEAAIRAAQNS